VVRVEFRLQVNIQIPHGDLHFWNFMHGGHASSMNDFAAAITPLQRPGSSPWSLSSSFCKNKMGTFSVVFFYLTPRTCSSVTRIG
jgi:hypothetical protein